MKYHSCIASPVLSRACLGLAAVFIAAGAVHANNNRTPHYVRRATWQESLYATREAMAKQTARLTAGVTEGQFWPGVTVGAWSAIGPFEMPDGEPGLHPLDAKGVVETESVVDLKRSYGDLQWQPLPELVGLNLGTTFGKVVKPLLQDRRGATGPLYLHCTLTAVEAMRVPVVVSAGTPSAFWLNGEPVYHRRITALGGSERGMRLTLRDRVNHLLMKVVQVKWGISIKASDPWPDKPSPEHALSPYWSRLARDFNDVHSLREMRWDRMRRIWDGPWVAVSLQDRYAAAYTRHIKGKAEDVGQARSLFYRFCRMEEVDRLRTPQAPSSTAPIESLRLAINDLMTTHGPAYPTPARHRPGGGRWFGAFHGARQPADIRAAP